MSMYDELPEVMRESRYVRDVYDGFDVIREYAETALDETENNMFVATTDENGLAAWEAMLGIDADEGAGMDDRRSVILSKLRGQGTCTAAMLKSMAESFSGGEVEVTETPQDYEIEIKFTSMYGVPPRVDEFCAAIERIIPAHIAYTLAYTYATWGQTGSHTWAEVSAHTWGEIMNGALEE